MYNNTDNIFIWYDLCIQIGQNATLQYFYNPKLYKFRIAAQDKYNRKSKRESEIFKEVNNNDL